MTPTDFEQDQHRRGVLERVGELRRTVLRIDRGLGGAQSAMPAVTQIERLDVASTVATTSPGLPRPPRTSRPRLFAQTSA